METVTVNDIDRIIIPSTRQLRPLCDCKGCPPYPTCYLQCHISKVYHLIHHFEKQIPAPGKSLDPFINVIKNANVAKELECSVCLDGFGFYALCNDCKYKVCPKCAPKFLECLWCKRPVCEIKRWMILSQDMKIK